MAPGFLLLPVQSNYSCGTCIIPEQASETLPAFNAIARYSLSRLGEQDAVSLPSVRALGMEVRKILVESAPQRTLTEQNEPGKTLFLYRAHPTFRERIFKSGELGESLSGSTPPSCRIDRNRAQNFASWSCRT